MLRGDKGEREQEDSFPLCYCDVWLSVCESVCVAVAKCSQRHAAAGTTAWVGGAL